MRRVLAYPKDRFRGDRPFYALFADSLQAQGMIVDEFSPSRCLWGSYDVLHLHHPEVFVDANLSWRSIMRFASFFFLAWLQKLKGCKIVWTAHNEGPHEPGHKFLERAYERLFPPLIDGVIYLSQASRSIVAERAAVRRECLSFVIPHGDFRDAYANTINKEEARSQLGYNAGCRVIVFFGNVRPYKGVDELVQAFLPLKDENLRLLIVGKFSSPEVKRKIADAIRHDSRVRLVDELVPAAQIQRYMNAADLVALPFRRILNSGSAILALSFNRPVLVPSLGSLRELQRTVGEDWLMLYDGVITTAILNEALEHFLGSPRAAAAPLAELEWGRIGRETAEAYSVILDFSRRRANS